MVVVAFYVGQDNTPVYKVSREVSGMNYFTQMPCGLCPVIDQCIEGGEISPQTCPYFQSWLSHRGEDDVQVDDDVTTASSKMALDF